MPTRIGPLDYTGFENQVNLETIPLPTAAWEKYDNFPGFETIGATNVLPTQNSEWNASVWAPSHNRFPNDQWAATFRGIGGTISLTRRIGPAIQMEPNRAAVGNIECYMASLDDDDVQLHHFNGLGSNLLLANAAGSFPNGISYRIELHGTIIKVYVDDILRITFDHGESTLQGGQPGLATANGTQLTGQSAPRWTAGDFLKEGPGPGVGRRKLVDTSSVTGRRITESRRQKASITTLYDRSGR